jgi:hypothetical protein
MCNQSLACPRDQFCTKFAKIVLECFAYIFALCRVCSNVKLDPQSFVNLHKIWNESCGFGIGLVFVRGVVGVAKGRVWYRIGL